MTHILEDLSHKIGGQRPKKEVSRFRGMYIYVAILKWRHLPWHQVFHRSRWRSGDAAWQQRCILQESAATLEKHGKPPPWKMSDILTLLPSIFHFSFVIFFHSSKYLCHLYYHLEKSRISINVLLPWLSARLNAGSNTGGFSTQIDGETLANWQNLYSFWWQMILGDHCFGKPPKKARQTFTVDVPKTTSATQTDVEVAEALFVGALLQRKKHQVNICVVIKDPRLVGWNTRDEIQPSYIKEYFRSHELRIPEP